jgi:hypothetical protein
VKGAKGSGSSGRSNDTSWIVSGVIGGGVSEVGKSHTNCRLSSSLGCQVGLWAYRLNTPSLLGHVWNGCTRELGGGVCYVLIMQS